MKRNNPHAVSSNRTLTAKFKQNGKTFNFIFKGEGWLEWWDDRGDFLSHTFLKSDLVNAPNYYSIRPVADQGWDLGDDAWEVNGQMVESGQNGEFTITPAIYDAYPDGTTFCYNFFDPSAATVKITVISGKWQSNKWTNELGGMVGFTSTPITSTTQKTVQYGSMVTVYGSGKYGTQNNSSGSINWFYKVKGFYTPSHYTYKTGNNTDKDSWTFKATSDMTIYVDFEYAEHD